MTTDHLNLCNNDCLFTKCYSKHFSSLVLFAVKITHNKCASEEIVNDVFMKVWNKQIYLRPDNEVKAFTFVSVRNACYNHNGKINNTTDVPELEDGQHKLNDLIRIEVMREIVELVNDLPPQCGTIIKSLYFGGRKLKEVANELNLAYRTVINQRTRGLKLLRDKIIEI